jgi:NAD(P) transhydrogenase subunit beta
VIPTWAQIGYLVAAVCFIVALKALSSPRSARAGNLLGAAGAVLAVIITFVAYKPEHLAPILIALGIGTVGGVVGSRRVQMTHMPQLVALFNGVGGGAAALVALMELGEVNDGETIAAIATAFTKLQELMTTRPVTFPGLPVLFIASILGGIALAAWLVSDPRVWVGVLLCLVGLAIGVMLVLPVGGADVPIVISLLNAFTGLTVAAGGYVLGNTLLLIAGTLVGAAGTLLTKLMADAMGRSVFNILFGAIRGGSTLGAGTVSERPVISGGAEDVAILLGYANKVIIVPGYGLAVAQAQHSLRDLVEELQSRGVKVDYAIHPVAGRMPGHMNVLLAEAQVPYDQLREMDDINGDFKSTDVVLVVGANDVVNPAARNTPSAPIYGMPILNADEAQRVIFLKRSMRPGFAGIENELLYDPRTTLLFGDARDSLTKLLGALKNV